jgi:hypothetical protein
MGYFNCSVADKFEGEPCFTEPPQVGYGIFVMKASLHLFEEKTFGKFMNLIYRVAVDKFLFC